MPTMVRVLLDIADPPARITLKAMLEAEGHRVGPEGAQVVVADLGPGALRHAAGLPTLVLAQAGQIREAVAAMKNGVYGYIFVPFQPGEAGLMVTRAAQGGDATNADRPAGALRDEEARLIAETLRACRNNKAEAARRLGIGRNTLWRKLRKQRNASGGA